MWYDYVTGLLSCMRGIGDYNVVMLGTAVLLLLLLLLFISYSKGDDTTGESIHLFQTHHHVQG